MEQSGLAFAIQCQAAHCGHLRPLEWLQGVAFLKFKYRTFCNLNGNSGRMQGTCEDSGGDVDNDEDVDEKITKNMMMIILGSKDWDDEQR